MRFTVLHVIYCDRFPDFYALSIEEEFSKALSIEGLTKVKKKLIKIVRSVRVMLYDKY